MLSSFLLSKIAKKVAISRPWFDYRNCNTDRACLPNTTSSSSLSITATALLTSTTLPSSLANRLVVGVALLGQLLLAVDFDLKINRCPRF